MTPGLTSPLRAERSEEHTSELQCLPETVDRRLTEQRDMFAAQRLQSQIGVGDSCSWVCDLTLCG